MSSVLFIVTTVINILTITVQPYDTVTMWNTQTVLIGHLLLLLFWLIFH